jgi:mediator of RNA polymerase II transcription subunit 7
MSGLSSVYPTPPTYYKSFTNENVQRFKELHQSDGNSVAAPLDLLIPPEPQGTYRSFGSLWNEEDNLPSLSEVGIKQLYNNLGTDNKDIQSSHQDRIWELKKLLKSLLINFLQLVDIMSKAPEEFPAKVEDIRVILINMHHLINEYRPHQSREGLILMIEDQIEKKRQEIDRIRKECDLVKERIAGIAKEFLNVLPEDVKESDEKGDQIEEGDPEKFAKLWRIIEKTEELET